MGLATRPLASYCDADAMYCHGGPTPMVLARMRGSGVSIRSIAEYFRLYMKPNVSSSLSGAPLNVVCKPTSKVV